jgi:serine protease DegQ
MEKIVSQHSGASKRARQIFPTTVALVALLVGAVALAGCGSASKVTSTAAGESPVGSLTTVSDIPGIVDQVEPEVVTVLTSGGGVGSGVIYRSDGIILTNEHVVRGNPDVQIAFADGSRDAGRVIAEDADTDLALVRVQRKDLPSASFQTTLPQVGSADVVLGSPLGFANTVTAGIVSGLHRSIPGASQESPALVDLLQTDAPISPGNSGGAVVDAEGEVIGITDAYIPPQQGAVAIGFAIPAATAVSVADELLDRGRVEHAFIGIQPGQLTPEVAQEFGLHESSGVLVYTVRRAVRPLGPGSSPGTCSPHWATESSRTSRTSTSRCVSTGQVRNCASNSRAAVALTRSPSHFRASPSNPGGDGLPQSNSKIATILDSQLLHRSIKM